MATQYYDENQAGGGTGGDNPQAMTEVVVGQDQGGNVASSNKPSGSSGGNANAGCTPDAFMPEVLGRPYGILRLAEWFCAMIMFSCIADIDNYADAVDGAGDAFKFTIATGVLVWLWCMFMIAAYMLDLFSQMNFLYITELAGDCVWTIFLFAASVNLAKECNEDYANAGNLCDVVEAKTKRKIQAAITFGFFCFFFFCGSVFFSFQRCQARS